MGFTKWLSRLRAKATALAEFQKRFPNAYMRQFTTEVEFDDKKHAAGEVQFKNGLETKIWRTFLDFLHLGHEFFVISSHGT